MNDDRSITAFRTLLKNHVNAILRRISVGHSEPTPDVLQLVRDSINEQFTAIFTVGHHRLSNDAIIWLVDRYFTNIRVNDGQIINDLVVTNGPAITELTDADITLLRDLFADEWFGQDLVNEFNRRLCNGR